MPPLRPIVTFACEGCGHHMHRAALWVTVKREGARIRVPLCGLCAGVWAKSRGLDPQWWKPGVARERPG